MSLSERLASGLKASLLAQAVFTISNGALVVLLTRTLGDQGYGLLNFALSILGVAAIFGTLGLPKSAARYVTEYAETDETQLPYILRDTLRYLLVLVAVVGVALAALSAPIASFLDTPALAPLLLVGVAFVALRALTQFLKLTFQGFNRVTLSALVRSVSSVGRVTFAVGFVLLGFGAMGALWGYVVGFALAAVVGLALLYTRFYVRFDRAEAREEGLSRRILEYSVPLTATRGANVLDKKVDMILVGALVSTPAVAYYALAKQIANFVSMPATSLGFTISPAVGEQKIGQRGERAARLYVQSLEHVLLLYVPAAVGLALVAEPTVHTVFGAAFMPAVPVVQVFAVFVLLNAITKITSDGLDYLGRARERAIVKGGTATANFLLNLALIPLFGVVGAAVATVLTYSVYTGVNVYYIHDELSLPVGRLVRHIAVIGVISVGMAVCVLALLPYVSSVVTLAGVVAAGVTVWGVLAVGSGLLDVRRVASYLV